MLLLIAVCFVAVLLLFFVVRCCCCAVAVIVVAAFGFACEINSCNLNISTHTSLRRRSILIACTQITHTPRIRVRILELA